MLTIVTGAPFAGKAAWVDREIERLESGGTVGTLRLDYTSTYASLIPGLQSVYRDSRITDSGAARFAGWVLAAAVREAGERELDGFVLTDSARRALALTAALRDAPLVEVTVSESTALARSRQHVELVRELAPRAGDKTAERCKQMVAQYFNERPILPADTRRVTPPDIPSDRAIQYMWNAAIRAAKRGDHAKRDKWKRAAQRALAARGVTA